jgi:hypothetical protein
LHSETVMKRALRLLAAALTLAAAACGDRSGPTEPQGERLGVPFLLKEGESARLMAEPFRIRFSHFVSDSNCPDGVYCFVAGEVVGAFEVEVAGSRPSVVELSTGFQREKTFSGYTVKVLECVEGNFRTGEPYVFRLLITK